jgi:hypothetical protein
VDGDTSGGGGGLVDGKISGGGGLDIDGEKTCEWEVGGSMDGVDMCG